MSLRVWLPLISNTKNLGLCGDNLITSNVTFNDGGKIGNKYLSGGTITIPASISKTFFNKNHMSFTFWLYPIGSTSSSVIMGRTSMSAGDNRMYSIFQYSIPNDLHLSWQDETSSSTFLGGSWPSFFPADTWTHCCIVYNGEKVMIYRNGELYTTANGTSNRNNFEYDFPIVGSPIRKLNDVRIYDHALSPMEVKQISQGLILHYPLNRNGWGQENLITGTSSIEKNYTYPSSGYQDKFAPITTIIPSGNKYTLSFYAKSTVAGDKIRAHYYSPNTTTTCVSSQGITRTASDGNMDFTLTTNWKLYWVTYTQTETTAKKHIIIPRMGAIGNTQGIVSGTGTVSIKCIKFEEGDKPTPWCPNSADELYNTLGLNDNI